MEKVELGLRATAQHERKIAGGRNRSSNSMTQIVCVIEARLIESLGRRER